MKADDIIKVLPDLTEDDLKKVRDTISFLLGSEGSGPDVVITAEEEELLDAMQKVIVSENIAPMFNYRIFKGSKYFKDWRVKIKGLANFVEKHFGKLSKVDRLGVYVLMYSILVNDLRQRNIPVSIGSITNNSNRLAETLNAEFPDYLNSGLGRVILKAMKRGHLDG